MADCLLFPGIATAAQALIDAGCEQLQGFLFSPGIPAEAFRLRAGAFWLADHGLSPRQAR